MKEITQDTFKEEISKGIVIVDMFADWCGPCRALSPILEELSSKFENITFAKLDIDSAEAIANEYEVSSIPTVIIFNDGKEAKRIIGLFPKIKYEEDIRAVINN